jgi:Domain of unknown function (DUF6894)
VAATYVCDDVGSPLPNLLAARRHALAVARELMQNNPDQNVSTWAIEVMDREGHHLLTVPFIEASK